MNRVLAGYVGCLLLLPSSVLAKGEQLVQPPPAETGWQLIGPGGGGRITSIAEDPSNPRNLYLTINVGGARRSRDSGNTWEIMNRGFDYAHLGKGAQQMMSIAVHPTDSRAILAAGLNGDLYAWDDASQAWRLSYRYPRTEGAREFAFARFIFHPQDPNTAYISVGNLQKLLLGVAARRAGAFWPPIAQGPTILRGHWHPETRAWRWSVAGELCPGNGRGGGSCLNIYALDINPQSQDELFAMTEQGLYVGGVEPDGVITAWTQVTTGLPPSELIHGGKIVFDRSTPGVAYLTILNLKDAQWHEEAAGGVFKSEDGGRHWMRLRGGLDLKHANYFDFHIDPKDAQTLYVAQFTNEVGPGRIEGTLYRSTDGGRQWMSVVDPQRLDRGWIDEVEHRPKQGPDFVSISAHTAAVRWTASGGILFEGDGNAQRPMWRNLLTRRMSAGPEGAARWTTTGSEAIALIKSIALDPTNSDVLYLPCGDHAYFKSEDGGRTVQALTSFPDIKAAGNAGDSGTFLVDEQQPTILYAATEGPHQQFVDGGVMYSKDAGKTWGVVGGHTHARRGTLPRGGMTDLLVEYTQPGARNLYVANHGNAKGQGSGVYVLHDALTGPLKKKNRQWKRLFATRSQSGAVRSLTARDGFRTVFVGVDNEGLYKLRRDTRGAWVLAKGPLALGGSTTFYDLETAPQSQTVYAATDAGLFTIDREDRVARVAIPAFAGPAPPQVRAIEIHPKDERILYVASEKIDVLRSADGGRAWEPISQGIPTLGLVTLQVDPNSDTIYAAGPGTGVWKRRFGPRSEGTRETPEAGAADRSRRELAPDSPFGINSTFRQVEDLQRHGALLQDLSVSWVSDSLFRRKIEPQRGVYDWSEPDALVEAYRRLGLRILFVLNPLTTWDTEGIPVDQEKAGGQKYLLNTEEGFRAWSDYVAVVARRYKSQVQAWMIYNRCVAQLPTLTGCSRSPTGP